MWGVLSAAQLVSQRSAGAFDITVGPLVRLWGFHDKKPHVPTRRELQQVRPLIGYQNVVLDQGAQTVSFTRSGVELDLGGIAKGFAVELAGGVLRRRGFSGLIDAGGNQYLVGHPAGKSSWQVGIEDPDKPGGLLGVLDIDGGAVSTSGGYHNFFVADGKTYGHLLDPRSLRPSDSALSVTIVSPDATLADALSKPAFILGPAAGLKLVESFPGTLAIIATRKRRWRRGAGDVGAAPSALSVHHDLSVQGRSRSSHVEQQRQACELALHPRPRPTARARAAALTNVGWGSADRSPAPSRVL